MNTPERYTVIGAGHGGKAMAAHLALMRLKVTLYNRTFDHISVIKKRGGIELESAGDGPHGFGKLTNVTSDIGEALKKAQMIMVVVPSRHMQISPGLLQSISRAGRSSCFTRAAHAGRWNLPRCCGTRAARRMSPFRKRRLSFMPADRTGRHRRASSASRRPCRWRHCRPHGMNRCWRPSTRSTPSSLMA